MMIIDPIQVAHEFEQRTHAQLIADRSNLGVPRFLYRFLGPDPEDGPQKIKEIVVDSKFYLVSKRSFNDPFDVTADLTMEGAQLDDYLKHLSRRIEDLEQRETFLQSRRAAPSTGFQVIYDVRAAKFGLVCFSSNAGRGTKNEGAARNILMWSHYADHHRGVCLQFSTLRSFGTFATASPVQYRDQMVRVNMASRSSEKSLARSFFRKAPGWRYECEFRIVANDVAGTHLPFQPRALTGIVFGCKAEPEFIFEVIEMVRQRARAGHPRVRLYRAVRSPSSFRLHVQWAKDMQAEATL